MTGPKPATLAALREAEAQGMTRREAGEWAGVTKPTVAKYADLFGLTFKAPDRLPRETVRALAGRYHVYTHTLDGEVIYIGAGKNTRPHDMARRSDLWKAKVAGRRQDVQVGIIASFASKWDALDLELRLIRDCNPTCCCKQGGTVTDEARDTAIRQLRSTGLTLQAIGDRYGLTRERVRQICSGRTYGPAQRRYSRERYHIKKALQGQEAAA